MLNKNIFKTAILSLLILSIGACTKDNNAPDNNNDGTITFDANGQHIKHSGSYQSLATTAFGVAGDKLTLNGNTTYNLNGQSGTNNICIFQINTDSLKEQTYPYAQLGLIVIDINGKEYGIFNANPKNFTITVTHHSEGRLSATFGGSLYYPKDLSDPSKGYDSLLVTNGEIKNMEMIY